ncbi:MAG: hypothetical protein QNJ64_17495, partial [Crocosphaera sp.]|nr:hypothetical protein [Crocosphaera sp.]
YKNLNKLYRKRCEGVFLTTFTTSAYNPLCFNQRRCQKKSEIEGMLLDACGQRCQDMTFISYPTQKDRRSIVQVKLSN